MIVIVGDDLSRTRNVSGMRRRRFCGWSFLSSPLCRVMRYRGDNEDERVKLVIFGLEKKLVRYYSSFLFSFLSSKFNPLENDQSNVIDKI